MNKDINWNASPPPHNKTILFCVSRIWLAGFANVSRFYLAKWDYDIEAFRDASTNEIILYPAEADIHWATLQSPIEG